MGPQTDPRNRVREWMQRVLDAGDINANQWAKDAGVSPTVITRFLAKEGPPIPSTVSIIKLSAAIGHGPDFLLSSRIPVLKSAQDVRSWLQSGSFSNDSEWVAVGGSITMGLFGLKVVSGNLLNKGITYESTIIADGFRVPGLGDLVVAGSGDEVDIFVFKPPYLEPDCPAVGKTWALENAEVLAVITRFIVDVVPV